MRVAQLLAVFRLEIRKSFFSKRGLWIYALALLPILIWLGHGLDRKNDARRYREMADRNPRATTENMRRIRNGMTREEVIELAGEPAARFRMGSRRNRWEMLRYSDGKEEYNLEIRDNTVRSVRIHEGCELGEETRIQAALFQLFFVRLAIFFGCVFVFMNLFRGEILDRSLHYYFLAPVRREIVVAGKFLAGLTATSIIFAVSTVLQMGVFAWHLPAAAYNEYVTNGPLIQHTLSYAGVAALACVGYGSVFLTAGMFLRNPPILTAIILFWESINGILPAVLRQFSVIYYLKSLAPVDLPAGRGVPPPLALLAMNVENARPIVAILGLLILAAILLSVSAYKSRSMEISYGTE